MPARSLAALLPLCFIAAALLLTARSLEGPFVFDDLSAIVRNTEIRSLSELAPRLFHRPPGTEFVTRNDPLRPLMSVVNACLFAAFGLSPVAFHVAGAILHGLSAWLAFLLARCALAKAGVASPHGPAAAAAIWMLVSPIQLGTAIYAYGMSDQLSAIWIFAASYLYLRRDALGWRATAASVAMLAAGLATKQSTAVIPALLFVADRCLPSPVPGRPRLPAWAPHALLVGLYLAAFAAAFGRIADIQGEGHTRDAWTYLGVQPYVILRYASLSLWPFGLAIDHDVSPELIPRWQLIVAWTFCSAVVVWIVARLWRPRASGEPQAWAAAHYLICLAPTSSFLPTVDYMVERRVYAADLGLYVLAALALARIRLPLPRRALLGVSAVAMAAFAFHRGAVFRSVESIWKETLAQYPTSARAASALGSEYLMAMRYDEARAVLRDRVTGAATDSPIDITNLAATFIVSGPDRDLDRAVRLLDRSIAANPRLSYSHYLRGLIAKERKDYSAARVDLSRAAALDDSSAPAFAHLAHACAVLAAGADPQAAATLRAEARRHAEAALALDPSNKLASEVRSHLEQVAP